MKRLICAIAILALSLNMTLAQATKKAGTKSENKTTSGIIQPAATTPVTGSGTPGQLTKWMGVDGSNTFTVGDSNITEDKFGKIGVGTRTPTSLFTAKGMIETTLGGYKFPDGTVQSTAGLASLFHDSTLTGNGTSASSLGVAVPLLFNRRGSP